jgi:glycerol uptake facilitator-like aquaporin
VVGGQPRGGELMGHWQDELRRLVAELLGTGSLLAAIVGSGIVTHQDGAASGQLFHHAIVIGVTLSALILTFGPISGAHFNPVVTMVDVWFGGLPWARAGGYVVAQLVGAVTGTIATAMSFGLPAVEIATLERGGGGRVGGEMIATVGLILVIFGLVRSGGGKLVAGAVGAYIAGAIYFTSSAAFANPAVTVARMLTDTYTAIDPTSVPGFLAGQIAGAVMAALLVRWLFAPDPVDVAAVVAAHGLPLPQVPR